MKTINLNFFYLYFLIVDFYQTYLCEIVISNGFYKKKLNTMFITNIALYSKFSVIGTMKKFT